jgi:ATP-dependent DNA helicase RecQ
VYGRQDIVQLRQLVDSSEADELHKRRERHKLDALLGWCEVTSCRRRPLLAYFGEAPTDGGEGTPGCGNCDNCLVPPRTWDGTEAARKLLSAVYRTGQSFGAAHVVDVLLGNATEKVTRHRHERLSVFNIGADLTAQGWRSLIRQLMVRGFLQVDHAGYGALVLTEPSRALLRGEVVVHVREDAKELAAPRKKTRAAAGAASAAGAADVPERDRELWEALRECRRRLAIEHNVPPYVIFHDATLRAMLADRPADRDALLRVHGIGQAKLDRYGDQFLAVLRGAAGSAPPSSD